MNWTDEEIEQLRALHAAGLRLAAIAGRMGRTKRSVIDKCGRLNLRRYATRRGSAPAAGRRGAFSVGIRPLPEPTEALPGTTEKVAVFERRVERGEELYHPLDAQR